MQIYTAEFKGFFQFLPISGVPLQSDEDTIAPTQTTILKQPAVYWPTEQPPHTQQNEEGKCNGVGEGYLTAMMEVHPCDSMIIKGYLLATTEIYQGDELIVG